MGGGGGYWGFGCNRFVIGFSIAEMKHFLLCVGLALGGVAGVLPVTEVAAAQKMRQVVIGRGASLYESDRDASSQARAVSGGGYDVIEKSSRNENGVFITRLVIEF